MQRRKNGFLSNLHNWPSSSLLGLHQRRNINIIIIAVGIAFRSDDISVAAMQKLAIVRECTSRRTISGVCSEHNSVVILVVISKEWLGVRRKGVN